MNFWDLIRVILNVGLNWLVNQPIVKKVIQAAQKPSSTSKQPTKSGPEPDVTSVDPEVQRQQQEALRRQNEVKAKANQFDRDVSNMPRRKPVITRDEDNPSTVDDGPAVRLIEPVGKGLSLLVNPDAQRVAQAMQTTPGIVDTAIRATGSPSSAFRFMWAENPSLTEDELDYLMAPRRKGRTPPMAKPIVDDNPDTSLPATYKISKQEAFIDALLLNVLFGVNLTADKGRVKGDKGEDLTDWQAWMQQPERIAAAWNAVFNTAWALKRANDAGQTKGGDPKLRVAPYIDPKLLPFALFRKVMGPIAFNLSADRSTGAALTGAQKIDFYLLQVPEYELDSDGKRILDPDGTYKTKLVDRPNFVPSEWNIVHELGHVIANRTFGYANTRVSNEVPKSEIGQKDIYRQNSDGKWSIRVWTPYLEDDSCPKTLTTAGVNSGLCRQHAAYDKNGLGANEEWADRFLFWVYNGFKKSSSAKEQADQWMADVISVAYGKGISSAGIQQFLDTQKTNYFMGQVVRARPDEKTSPQLRETLGSVGSDFGQVPFNTGTPKTKVIVLGKDKSGNNLFVIYNGYTGWIPSINVVNDDKQGTQLNLTTLPIVDQTFVKEFTAREYDEQNWNRIPAKVNPIVGIMKRITQ